MLCIEVDCVKCHETFYCYWSHPSTWYWIAIRKRTVIRECHSLYKSLHIIWSIAFCVGINTRCENLQPRLSYFYDEILNIKFHFTKNKLSNNVLEKLLNNNMKKGDNLIFRWSISPKVHWSEKYVKCLWQYTVSNNLPLWPIWLKVINKGDNDVRNEGNGIAGSEMWNTNESGRRRREWRRRLAAI